MDPKGLFYLLPPVPHNHTQINNKNFPAVSQVVTKYDQAHATAMNRDADLTPENNQGGARVASDTLKSIAYIEEIKVWLAESPRKKGIH